MVTESDVLSGGHIDDEVAYGGWPLDGHNPNGMKKCDGSSNVPSRMIPVDEPYGLPLRARSSKNIGNLYFAGRNISVTHVALSSTRVMATCSLLGQAFLTDEDIAYTVRTLGQKRLQGLHVHDNDGIEDSHTLPFTRKIDFAALASALKEIGYQGDLTLEADNWLKGFPRELVPDALSMMYKAGRYLAG